ncbi:MAG: alpha-L-fucosidase, partial [Bacteroidales bacterium]|nr:alpha-L-fucosidase [Bacteroidales bacterium]
MKFHNCTKLIFTVLTITLATLFVTPVRAQDYVPSDENLASREAFRSDRFGIFIHWGIYSMLARGEWALNSLDLNYQEYAKLAGGFYPSNFNAAEWVSAIKASGARYICITSRHHDGFSMFGTKLSPYNIVDATPFGRDILKELAEECERQGISLHFYYSLLDWTRLDYPRGRTGLGVGRPEGTEDYGSYLEFMKGQLTELLTGYGPVRAIWFDGHWDHDEDPDFDWKYDEIYPLIHSLRPGCLIGNNHHLTPFEGEDIQIFERDLPGENKAGLSGQDIASLPLETCETMNGMWGYKITDQNYKDVPTLIRYIVSAAGRDANLLMNIGPQPDGSLPAIAVERLKGVGEWMDKFGFTVYGTRACEVAPHEWGVVTAKDNRRYVHILSLQDNSLFVPLTSGKVTNASCLNDGSAVSFTQDPDGVLL